MCLHARLEHRLISHRGGGEGGRGGDARDSVAAGQLDQRAASLWLHRWPCLPPDFGAFSPQSFPRFDHEAGCRISLACGAGLGAYELDGRRATAARHYLALKPPLALANEGPPVAAGACGSLLRPATGLERGHRVGGRHGALSWCAAPEWS